jgi:L-amino acid N-acyltransferase YncA
MEIIIRKAKLADLPALTEIFNQAILSKVATGYTETFTADERKSWFHEHDWLFPIIVCESNNQVIGWASVSPYRPGRKAFERTVEISYFIHQDFQRKGIGSLLLKDAVQFCKEIGYKVIIAILFHTNIGSIKLLEKHNFEKAAVIPEVGEIDGKLLNHIYYIKRL